jgi:Domain of unknown function (DUF389)
VRSSGAGRRTDLRVDRAGRRVPRLHGPGGDHRRRRPADRLGGPHHRGHDRRPGLRASGRHIRCDRDAPLGGARAVARGAPSRFRARGRRRVGLTEIARATEPAPGDPGEPILTEFVAHPSRWSIVVALAAGVAGKLSLTTLKSGALVGVLVSVTTIPALANKGVATAYGDWSAVEGSGLQLVANVSFIVATGGPDAARRAPPLPPPRAQPSRRPRATGGRAPLRVAEPGAPRRRSARARARCLLAVTPSIPLDERAPDRSREARAFSGSR